MRLYTKQNLDEDFKVSKICIDEIAPVGKKPKIKIQVAHKYSGKKHEKEEKDPFMKMIFNINEAEKFCKELLFLIESVKQKYEE